MVDDQVSQPTSRDDLARRIISLIDLTDLDDDHRPDGIDTLVARAVEHGTAAVCVWPEYVERVVHSLRGSTNPMLVATVVNFPAGDSVIPVVVAETERALAAGADEIDVVLPYHSLLADDVAHPRAMVEAVASVVHAADAHLKVILETGELSDPTTIATASEIAIESGADFIKTSTGKTPVGATLDAVDAMVGVIAAAQRPVGLKPSGGIRTVDDAAAYLSLVDNRLGGDWASASSFRFGASGLLDDALAVLHRS